MEDEDLHRVMFGWEGQVKRIEIEDSIVTHCLIGAGNCAIDSTGEPIPVSEMRRGFLEAELEVRASCAPCPPCLRSSSCGTCTAPDALEAAGCTRLLDLPRRALFA